MLNGKIHYKWPFSIAMLNYQRVSVCSIWTVGLWQEAEQLLDSAFEQSTNRLPVVPVDVRWCGWWPWLSRYPVIMMIWTVTIWSITVKKKQLWDCPLASRCGYETSWIVLLVTGSYQRQNPTHRARNANGDCTCYSNLAGFAVFSGVQHLRSWVSMFHGPRCWKKWF